MTPILTKSIDDALCFARATKGELVVETHSEDTSV